MEHNISNLMHRVSGSLAEYLERVLPEALDDWWQDGVLNVLHSRQRENLEQRGISSLKLLDLASLLRVLDSNWYHLSTKMDLSSESRHFVKEMQTVRNRWAHVDTEGFSDEDVYRDFDTLQRFASVIEADSSIIHEIHDKKKSLLTERLPPTPDDQKDDEESEPGTESNSTDFELTQMVYVKSDPTSRGPIITIVPGEPEDRYNVFIGGKTQTFYGSQIQAEDREDKELQIQSCNEFHSNLTAIQIRQPGLSTLYSLNAARVDFIPYQFRPVLKFIRSDRPRLLIADGVGVGKTIEAGLILRELQARRDIHSVLIICPRPLVTERKWQIEMKRFEERFTHLDGGTLRFCINELDLDGVWPDQYQKVIMSYSLFDKVLLEGSEPGGKRKRGKGLLNLDPPPRFDLVIVDEAHHIRNPETYTHKAVRYFSDNAEAVVFLTATPIQMGSHDLFVLLNTLRPDLIIDRESFEHMAAPNPFINQAVALARAQEPEWATQAAGALDEAATTAWGRAILRQNPDFNRIRNQLVQDEIASADRIQLITNMEALHTFAGIISRTRRRDIAHFTVRKPETVTVEFTPAQKKLHDELLEIQAEIFSQLHGDINVKFLMTTIRRQAASCIYGLAPFLQDILNRHIDELSWEEADNTQVASFENVIGTVETRIQDILEQTRNLDSFDPKLNALQTILKNKQTLPNNKIILFSSFRHTLRYLYQNLKKDDFRIGMVHGDTPDEERNELRNRFEMERGENNALDALLFSEIGCEGLDYQFCDCIVNYDLPWNPMRIEQRIGRIDRWGQKSESVAIFNLITPGTVDADIYERCLLRIGVFTSAIGGTEDILGEVSKEIRNIAEDLSLSEEERREKFQQLADNKIRFVQEQEKLEQRQVELFGLRLPEDLLKQEIVEASSYWLSPSSIQNLITHYLIQTCGEKQEHLLGEKPLKTLRLSQEARNRLLEDFQKLPRQNTVSYREWENWLKGGSPHLSMTFESECASQHRDAAFIMPLHPLVRQASEASDTAKRVVAMLKSYDSTIPEGRYHFAIYQWQFHGIKEDLILCPVANSDSVTSHLSKLLEKAEEDPTGVENMPDPSDWDKLDANHYKLWSVAQERHRQNTREIARYRRESLATSHQALKSLLEEQLQQATDDRITRMRESQIITAEADYSRRLQDLDIAMERSDVTARPVAYGAIHISGEATHGQ